MLSPWWEEIRWGLSKNPNDPNDFSNDLQSLPSAGLLASERIPGARKFERALDARGERPGVQYLQTTNQVENNQGGYQDQTSLIELVKLVGLDGLLSRCGGLDGRLDQVRCRRVHPHSTILQAWGQVLSPGERQRLLWARILHQRPSLALLDEATR